jgi:hypothetical protein
MNNAALTPAHEALIKLLAQQAVSNHLAGQKPGIKRDADNTGKRARK